MVPLEVLLVKSFIPVAMQIMSYEGACALTV